MWAKVRGYPTWPGVVCPLAPLPYPLPFPTHPCAGSPHPTPAPTRNPQLLSSADAYAASAGAAPKPTAVLVHFFGTYDAIWVENIKKAARQPGTRPPAPLRPANPAHQKPRNPANPQPGR